MEDVVCVDYRGRKIRPTAERQAHILEHPEMIGQIPRIGETLAAPELVIATTLDDAVQVYHLFYAVTPVTRKFLQVAVKLLTDDAFVVTAYYSNKPKKGQRYGRNEGLVRSRRR